MKSRALIKVLVVALVVSGGLGYSIYQAMQSSWSYYYSVDELAEKNLGEGTQSLRVAGKVKAGSVNRDLENVSLAFTLAGAEAELPVKYKGVVPDNFAEGREVVVEGVLGGGVLKADLLMTRCESKYKAKVN